MKIFTMIAHRYYLIPCFLFVSTFISISMFKADISKAYDFLFQHENEPHEVNIREMSVRRGLLYEFSNLNNFNVGQEGVTIDLMSIGSKSRSELITAQKKLMSKHPSVRSSWWLTEFDDDDRKCSVGLDTVDYLSKCTDPKVDPWTGNTRGPLSKRAANLHWTQEKLEDDGYTPSNQAGWICAQRRVGYGIGERGKAYQKTNDLPDFLVLMDDDTYINLDLFVEHIKTFDPLEPIIHAGFIFPIKNFEFAWGGYAVVIPRASLERLTQPLSCTDDRTEYDSEFETKACESLRKDAIGEKQHFKQGMTLADFAYALSARNYFCMHSDHFFGYLIKYYHLSEETRGSIGPFKKYDGAVSVESQCEPESHICHHMRINNFTDVENFPSYLELKRRYNKQ